MRLLSYPVFKKCTCQLCKSVFQVDESDFFSMENARDDETIKRWKIECPVCGHWCSVEFDGMVYEPEKIHEVSVVRCRDCIYCRNLPNGLCYAWTEPCDNERGYKGEVHCVEPDDFCSFGKDARRTGSSKPGQERNIK